MKESRSLDLIGWLLDLRHFGQVILFSVSDSAIWIEKDVVQVEGYVLAIGADWHDLLILRHVTSFS